MRFCIKIKIREEKKQCLGYSAHLKF